jgi:hypothetical protein
MLLTGSATSTAPLRYGGREIPRSLPGIHRPHPLERLGPDPTGRRAGRPVPHRGAFAAARRSTGSMWWTEGREARRDRIRWCNGCRGGHLQPGAHLVTGVRGRIVRCSTSGPGPRCWPGQPLLCRVFPNTCCTPGCGTTSRGRQLEYMLPELGTAGDASARTGSGERNQRSAAGAESHPTPPAPRCRTSPRTASSPGTAGRQRALRGQPRDPVRRPVRDTVQRQRAQPGEDEPQQIPSASSISERSVPPSSRPSARRSRCRWRSPPRQRQRRQIGAPADRHRCAHRIDAG